jgi:hypothetical protein
LVFGQLTVFFLKENRAFQYKIHVGAVVTVFVQFCTFGFRDSLGNTSERFDVNFFFVSEKVKAKEAVEVGNVAFRADRVEGLDYCVGWDGEQRAVLFHETFQEFWGLGLGGAHEVDQILAG